MASKTRKTAFVPRVVFATALVTGGVIPLCVSACGSETTTTSSPPQGVANNAYGVGAQCFSGPNSDCAQHGVADAAFDGGAKSDATSDAGLDAPSDAGDADAGLGVADVGFGG